MQLVQCEFTLEHEEDAVGRTHQVAWVDADRNLKPGDVVTFRHDSRRWMVGRVGVDRKEIDTINKVWRVGGLI